MPLIREIIEAIYAEAPASLAMEQDNIGLQVGDSAAEASHVLLAVDVSPQTVTAALSQGAQLLLAHHPLIYAPLKQVTASDPVGALILQAAKAGLAVVSMHTNADFAPGGLCDSLAEKLGVKETRPLTPVSGRMVKLVVFVPLGHLEEVREAMARAGAGRIGDYEECAFASHGTGSYRPLAGAQPFAGRVGRLEFAEEARLEMLAPKSLLPQVLTALRAAHPYEEVAFDICPLQNDYPAAGMGRIGRLASSATVGEFARQAKQILNAEAVRLCGSAETLIERVAITTGSGGSLVEAAHRAGAQLLVGADINHHQARLAEQLGLAVLDLGHLATERVAAEWFRRILGERFGDALTLLETPEMSPFHPV